MSTTNYASRSNYFKVTDEDRLKEIAELTGFEVWHQEDREVESLAIGLWDDHDMDFWYDEDDHEHEVYPEIQKILAPGEICVIHTICHEKLRYIRTWITFITKDKIEVDGSEYIITDNINEMMPDAPEYNYQTDY